MEKMGAFRGGADVFLCPSCVRLMGSLRLSQVTQADFFPYHTEISPPANTASSGHNRRQTTLLSCLQSECSFPGSLGSEVYLYWYPDVRARVGRRGMVGASKLSCSHRLQLGRGVQAHHSPWLLRKQKVKVKTTTYCICICICTYHHCICDS